MSKSKLTPASPTSVEEYEEVISSKEKIFFLQQGISEDENELEILQKNLVEFERKVKELKISYEIDGIELEEVEKAEEELGYTKESIADVTDNLNTKREALKILESRLKEAEHTAKLNRIESLKKIFEDFRTEHLSAVKQILKASDELINLKLVIFNAEKEAGVQEFHFPDRSILEERYPHLRKLIEQIWDGIEGYDLAKTCNVLNSRHYYDIPYKKEEDHSTADEKNQGEKNDSRPGWHETKVGNSIHWDRLD